MSNYPEQYLGLDVTGFWAALERALVNCLSERAGDACTLYAELLPKIVLSTEY